MTAVSVNHTGAARNHMILGLILLAWASLATWLGAVGFYHGHPGAPPLNLLLGMATSLGLFTVCYRFIPGVRDYVLKLDMRLLILLHGWRALGLAFLFLYSFSLLPAPFAFSAGLGDALTAYSATLLAYFLLTRPGQVHKNWIWAWNTFGLLDFVAAVSLGLLSRQGAPLASHVSSDIMTELPMVLVPGFVVQVYLLTHIIIYLQLKNREQPV